MSILPAKKTPCYPLREGNIAIPYIDGKDAMDSIFNAILNANSSVWLTMCYAKIHFKIPSLNKSIIEIISEVSQKENMDLRILAWRSKAIKGDFEGTKKEFKILKNLNCKAKIRWDSNKFGCHHQKIFIIDGKNAFVGGVNMSEKFIDTTAHDRKHPHPTHDLFCEVRGPVVSDVIHNFVQRWNGATEKNKKRGSFPQDTRPDNLSNYQEQQPQENEGNIKIQVTRTIPKGAYEDKDIKKGEYSIRESYLNAIKGAQKYIYLENQYFFDKVSHRSVIRELIYAAYRGVKIFIVLPGNPDFTKLFSKEFLREVKNHPNIYVYTLATSYEDNRKGKEIYSYNDIYVHAKLFIIDDEWYSIGSANISYQSLRTDSEINVAVWDSNGAKKLRQDLWKEHLEYSDKNKTQYKQKVIIDNRIKAAFEQWWFFAGANKYNRSTMVRAENRLMPLDIKKYTSFKKWIGFVKDFSGGVKKQLSGILGSLIEMVREHT
jgi:phosphatidylserine/phosphatidylglycerophosphate/cardiolipin synthase-like enzyme